MNTAIVLPPLSLGDIAPACAGLTPPRGDRKNDPIPGGTEALQKLMITH
jgi:hypothetical protein